MPVMERRTPLRPAGQAGKPCSAAAEKVLLRHPALSLAAALVLSGCAMVLAVSLCAALCVLPLGLLFGWN